MQGEWLDRYNRNDASRAVDKAFYLWHTYHASYVWGGGSNTGIDCSHFVCACYFGKSTTGVGSYTYATTSYLRSLCNGGHGFEQMSYSKSKRKAADVLNNPGSHTGICVDDYISSYGDYYKGYDAVIQSYGGHGVGVLANGDAWKDIYRPFEGLGIYISKVTLIK